MNIIDDKLIIQEDIPDEGVFELVEVLKQDEIKEIELNGSNYGASIIQLLMYAAKTKKIRVRDQFLSKFFNQIYYR